MRCLYRLINTLLWVLTLECYPHFFWSLHSQKNLLFHIQGEGGKKGKEGKDGSPGPQVIKAKNRV